MKLVFYSNFLNHHQVMVADELYKLLGNEFAFVATMPVDETLLKGGSDYSTKRDYCVRTYASEHQGEYAMQLAREAEVCVFGAGALEYEKTRAVESPDGLSFEISERWLKRGWINIVSPRILKRYVYYHLYFKRARFYRLAAGAFTSHDDKKLGIYNGRSFKWGYFTRVDDKFDVNASIFSSSKIKGVPIMWCARFLTLKRPELPIHLAKKLKDKGYEFTLSMFGDEGNAAKHERIYPRKKLESLINELGVQDCVTLMGNHPNHEILCYMRQSAIFLFTSNRLEGWGAVANESMANGCVLVASDAIGSTPYLIENGKNGFQFKSGDVNSLTEKIEWLLSNRSKMEEMQKNANMQIKKFWNPRHAAMSLLQLIADLQNGQDTSLEEGPCSKA